MHRSISNHQDFAIKSMSPKLYSLSWPYVFSHPLDKRIFRAPSVTCILSGIQDDGGGGRGGWLFHSSYSRRRTCMPSISNAFCVPPFCARASPRPRRTLGAHTMESDKKWRQSDDPPPSSGWKAAARAAAADGRHDLCGKSIKPQEVGRKSGRI